jgi:DNA-binding MarR family transcriptional regulator
VVNIIFTSNWLNRHSTEILKPHDITLQQYNILRILKGQFPKPSTIGLLTERMLDKMSNASRLVEKLLAKGLVERNTCPKDRRQVHVLITEKGKDLVELLSKELDQHNLASDKLDEKELALLSDLLDKLRS